MEVARYVRSKERRSCISGNEWNADGRGGKERLQKGVS